jgi:HD-like signal output (HDOD) protein
MPPAMNADPSFITRAPHSVAGWVAAFEQRDIPVFASTLAAIAEARENEDASDAHTLAELLADDPLMTLKLLRHVARQRRRRDGTDIESLTAALVMMGITPFFREFGEQETVQSRLADWPEAIEGLAAVRERAHRAARLALGFAVHRMDQDATLIHEAALMHDFAEMLLWVHAPVLALDIVRRQQADPQMRSTVAQRDVLGVALMDLQQALMKAWRLPEMLVRITDDHASVSPQVLNVQLAIRVSRHSAQGWDNPALPDDVDEVAALLNLATVPTLQLLHDLAGDNA